MDKAYYIENKSYFVDSNGTDIQVADGGDLPIIYHSLKKALNRCESMIKLLTEKMGYTIVIPNHSFPGVGEHYLYACRLTKDDPQIRVELRLYTIWIL